MSAGENRSAVVIGGGVVGLTSALALRRLGLSVTLIDAKPTIPCASYGNAGHIAIEQVEPIASWSSIRSAPQRLFAFGGALDVRDLSTTAPWMLRLLRAAAPASFRAGKAALRALLDQALPSWRALVADLQRPDLLREEGHILLWESKRSARRGRASWDTTDIGSATLHDLSATELDSFGDLLAQRPAGGVRFRGSAQVADIAQLLESLRSAFAQAGGEHVDGRVGALEISEGNAVAVTTDASRIQTDVLLVAAGVGSSALMATVGVAAPVIAERGYHVQWSEHSWPQGLPPVVFEDRSMIVTRFGAGLRAAGFVEFAREQTPADSRKWEALRRHAEELGLPTAGVPETWFGARPTLPDYLPAIGRSNIVSNLFYAFGHQHLGVTLAPITASIIAALVCSQSAPVSIAPFDLCRFQNR